MRFGRRILGFSGLLLCLVMISARSAQAQTPLKTINSPSGGYVMYGVVDGATTQPDAIVSVLRTVAKRSGESPQIGKPFRYRGTSTVGVFFTVVNHSAGNVPVAGLILSDFNAKKQVEAALVSDAATRFRTSLKPMMEALFEEWQPGGARSAAKTPPGEAASSGSSSAPTSSVSGGLLPMHAVTLPDNTASARIPDGWSLAKSGGGTFQIVGTHQEFILLNGAVRAVDPRSQGYQNAIRMRIQMPVNVVMPYNADLGRAFPNLYLSAARVLKWSPTDLKIEQSQMIPTPEGERCVQGQGHVNNFGNGPMELNAIFCPQVPTNPQAGLYLIYVYFSLIPNAYADQERLTASAVMASFSWDKEMVEQQAALMAAPVIAQMQNTYQQHMNALSEFTQSQINRTHQIGQEVTQRIADQQRANDEHNREFDQHEEDIRRYNQGFSNYILDQTVIQDNNYYGGVAHATVSNAFAESLVKADPNRFEYVPTPNYIPVIDFSK